MDRDVMYEEAKSFAEQHGYPYLETSAKTGANIEEAFVVVSKDIFERMSKGELLLEEGWEGIKDGMVRQEPVSLLEGEPGPKCC